MSQSANAGTVRLDPARLPAADAHGAGKVTPLAVAADGKPLTALLRIPAGQVLPPHGGADSEALVTVLSGTIAWGDGDTVDEAKEHKFAPGSILRVSGKHWAAARDGGDVLLQVVRIPAGAEISAPVKAADN